MKCSDEEKYFGDFIAKRANLKEKKKRKKSKRRLHSFKYEGNLARHSPREQEDLNWTYPQTALKYPQKYVTSSIF